MKEHPIIFSTEMVRAILEGRKTQTRRVIKPQPDSQGILNLEKYQLIWNGGKQQMVRKAKCPYGQVGDRLWVKETWDDGTGIVLYKADCTPQEAKEYGFGWSSPLFMFHCDSRITLEITGLRVERLQEITEEDAEAEGESWSGVGDGENYDVCSAVENYAHLWDSLNDKRGYGWEKNPWVWVIEFKILQ